MPGVIHTAYFKSDYGELIIGSYEQQLCLCDWRYRKMRSSIDKRIQTGLQAEYVEEESAIIDETRKQLSAYFAGELSHFDLPLLMIGSDFQKQVWELLLNIPFGGSSFPACAVRSSCSQVRNSRGISRNSGVLA